MKSDQPNNPKNSLFPIQETEPEDDDSWQVSYLDIITILLGFLVILLSFSELNNGESFSVSDLFTSLNNETEFITTPIEDIKEELENLLEPEIAQGKLEIFRDLNDVRIRFKSDDLYNSGSAQLEGEASQILDRVLEAFKLIKYNDFEIDVEGHTDNVPISSANFDSNWELSTSRASNIVKYFSETGIPQDRLKASGYADSRPLVEFDEQGNPYPASKDKNRRVVLRLYYSSPNHGSKADSTYAENESTPPAEQEASGTQTTDNELLADNEYASDPNYNDSNQESTNDQQLSGANSAPNEPEVSKETIPENNQNRDQTEEKKEQSSSAVTNFQNGCRYSIQVGEFESFITSFNFAKEAETRTGTDFEMMYNNSLFSARTVSSNSLSKTIALKDRIDENFEAGQITGFVQQCYDDGKKRPQPLQYQIQLGFFQNRQNAISFSNVVSEEYGIDAVVEQISLQAYSVLTKPLSNVSLAKNRLNTIQSIDAFSGAFIKYDPSSVYDYNFTYQIQLGSFAKKSDADILAQRLRDEMNVQSSIKTLSTGRYYLVTQPYFDWDEVTNLYQTFNRDASELSPTIFLIERV